MRREGEHVGKRLVAIEVEGGRRKGRKRRKRKREKERETIN